MEFRMPEDRFTGNVLRCIGKNKKKKPNQKYIPSYGWTIEEIIESYFSFHPVQKKVTIFAPKERDFFTGS